MFCVIFIVLASKFFMGFAMEILNIVTSSNTYVRETMYPHYGTCWTDVKRSVKAGCGNLSLEWQKYMALRFTDCFRLMSGDSAYGCDKWQNSEERNNCIQRMSTRDYNTFTDFFTHVDNLCRFLEIQVWQEDTEMKVKSLLSSSTKARMMLLEALNKQKISLQLQKMSTSEQMQIIKATSRLDDRLFELQSKTEQTVDSFSKATSGSYGVLMETFAGLSALRQWLANKTSWLETVIFYICAITVILLLTALPELEGVKWVLFSLLMVAVCVECGLWSFSLCPDVWFARNALMYVCAGLLCLSAYHHRETESANNRVMLEIERNIDDLEKLFFGARLLHRSSADVQNTEIASSDDRMSVSPDRKRVGVLDRFDKSSQLVRSSVTPDRTRTAWQTAGDKIRSSPRLSITPDRLKSENDEHQQINATRQFLQNPYTQVRSPAESLHFTRRTHRTEIQSVM